MSLSWRRAWRSTGGSREPSKFTREIGLATRSEMWPNGTLPATERACICATIYLQKAGLVYDLMAKNLTSKCASLRLISFRKSLKTGCSTAVFSSFHTVWVVAQHTKNSSSGVRTTFTLNRRSVRPTIGTVGSVGTTKRGERLLCSLSVPVANSCFKLVR